MNRQQKPPFHPTGSLALPFSTIAIVYLARHTGSWYDLNTALKGIRLRLSDWLPDDPNLCWSRRRFGPQEPLYALGDDDDNLIIYPQDLSLTMTDHAFVRGWLDALTNVEIKAPALDKGFAFKLLIVLWAYACRDPSSSAVVTLAGLQEELPEALGELNRMRGGRPADLIQGSLELLRKSGYITIRAKGKYRRIRVLLKRVEPSKP